MRYAPRKIFKLEEGRYIEISNDEYMSLMEENPMRRFWLFSGMLMELPEEHYVQMNREKARRQYLSMQATKYGEFPFDAIGADDFAGQVIIQEYVPDVEEVVELQILSEQLHEAIELTENQQERIVNLIMA